MTLQVEIAYARADAQWLLTAEVAPGATVADAITASGFRTQVLDFDPASALLGIFGEVCQADTVLRPGDRVEIHRPLAIDPKEARRRRT